VDNITSARKAFCFRAELQAGKHKRIQMINLTPFLLFDGNCAEAMAFYQSCLGGELTITRVADIPMKDRMPPEKHQRVTYARLKNGAIEFSATDWLHATRTPRQGNTVAMYINGGKYQELRAIFDRLRMGADDALLDDLREMPFGTYGHLADRYGVHWFFQGDKAA
jgi:PhnB protein